CYNILQDPQLTVLSSGTAPRAIAIKGAFVGGSSLSGYLAGVTNGVGLYNIGQLVKVWGKVLSLGAGYAMIDDGSKASGASGSPGLKIVTDGYTQPTVGWYVIATGIVECENSAGTVKPVVTIRKESDLVHVN
ncbi:MAG: hypothetical protein WCL39_00600, partial [Armatimonadota bacterium]